MTIKDIFNTLFCIVFLLYIVSQIIDAYCYFTFYRKYNKALKKYDYIVGYKGRDTEDVILNNKLKGDYKDKDIEDMLLNKKLKGDILFPYDEDSTKDAVYIISDENHRRYRK